MAARFMSTALPHQPRAELGDSGAAARIPGRENTIDANSGGIVRVVEDVEEVYRKPQGDAFLDADELERGCVLEPLPGSQLELVPEGVQVVVESSLLNRAVGQRDPHRVG